MPTSLEKSSPLNREAFRFGCAPVPLHPVHVSIPSASLRRCKYTFEGP
jgi:hypothetical protein